MRISEDIKTVKGGRVVLLTFKTESLRELAKKGGKLKGYELDNEICRVAVKLFRERWRKKYKRSIRHFLITELGHGKTEHVHMHGIVWEDERYKTDGKFLDEVERIWGYGFVGKGKYDYRTGTTINYVDDRTANYFTKYITKKDEQHKEYKQIILTSAGIGAGFLKSKRAEDNKFKGKKTIQQYYRTEGKVLAMPEYFRRKMYTDEEREKLAGWYLDEEITYIEGKRIELRNGDKEWAGEIENIYKRLRVKNEMLGFGDGTKNYERQRHENKRRMEVQKKRYYEDVPKLRIEREEERIDREFKEWLNS